MNETMPFVEFSGSDFEIGQQLGEFSKDRLPRFMQAERVVAQREKVLKRPRMLSDSLRAASDRYPRHLQEMSGIAAGAGVSLSEIFVFNWRPRPRAVATEKGGRPLGRRGSDPFFGPAPPAEGCTTLIVPTADRVLVAHNEDWYTGTNDIFLARLHYDSGLEFLGVCYHGFLPGLSASINGAGLVQALNNLTSSDGGAGVPLAFINRAVLEATSLDEAVAVVTQTGRADSENFVFAQGTRAVYVETSARDFEVVEVTTPTVHTNHFLVERLKVLEATERPGSTQARHARATAMLAALENPGPDDLRAILSSHEDVPLGICRHGREPTCDDYCDTLGTILIDTADGGLEVCYGPPCRSAFRRFTM